MKTRILLFIIAAAALAACDKKPSFSIKGEIEGKPTMNLYLKYYGDGAISTAVIAAKDGKFEINNSVGHPAILEIMDNDYRVLGRMYVTDGENLNVKLARNNPTKTSVTGSAVNEEWTAALTTLADSLNYGTPSGKNMAIEDYIAQHSDNLASTLLFISYYNSKLDPLRADSVLNSIAPEARPSAIVEPYLTVTGKFALPETYMPVDSLVYRTTRRDSVGVLRPADSAHSLIVFTDDNSSRTDFITHGFRPLMKVADSLRLQVLDFSLQSDTAVWKRTIKSDEADWTQGWAPGGVFAKGVDALGLPEVPYCIVLDSLGRQIYRGSDIDAAAAVAKDL